MTTPLERLLNSALRSVKYTCVLGASNNNEDRVAHGDTLFTFYFKRLHFYTQYVKREEDEKWQLVFSNTNPVVLGPEVLVELPEGDEAYPKDVVSIQSIKQYETLNLPLAAAVFGYHNRMGNCSIQSSLAYLFLWEHAKDFNKRYPEHPIRSIAFMWFENINHQALCINRAPQSDPDDPSTWGKDAWYLDPWRSKDQLIKASELPKHYEQLIKDCGPLQSSQVKKPAPNRSLSWQLLYDLPLDEIPFPLHYLAKSDYDMTDFDSSLLDVNLACDYTRHCVKWRASFDAIKNFDKSVLKPVKQASTVQKQPTNRHKP